MTNPVQAMFEAGVVEVTDFPPSSRYHGVPRTSIVAADGREIPYLRRRMVPQPERFATRGYRIVTDRERLDLIAAAEIGDPQAYWLICDAQGAIWPDDLEVAGTELRLTLPEGVPQAAEEL